MQSVYAGIGKWLVTKQKRFVTCAVIERKDGSIYRIREKQVTLAKQI